MIISVKPIGGKSDKKEIKLDLPGIVYSFRLAMGEKDDQLAPVYVRSNILQYTKDESVIEACYVHDMTKEEHLAWDRNPLVF